MTFKNISKFILLGAGSLVMASQPVLAARTPSTAHHEIKLQLNDEKAAVDGKSQTLPVLTRHWATRCPWTSRRRCLRSKKKHLHGCFFYLYSLAISPTIEVTDSSPSPDKYQCFDSSRRYGCSGMLLIS